MCYSARILADYRRYLRDYDAPMSLKEFVDLFWRRAADPRLKIPKAMELAFDDPQTPAEVEIKALIDRFNAEQVSNVEAELFRQRKRLADAQRSLREKSTKAALESERIANGKVEWALGKLSDLRRHEPIDEDSRIFPLHYAPVMVIENGRRTIKPMRYGCRLAGKPASHDIKFPGTYNARRDSLDGFWKGTFGVSHGLVVMDAFFENVNRHRAEGRALGEDEKVSNVILEFKPASGQPMLVACLWSRWSAPGEPDLLSFAAITDDPPPEIANAGHDRCVIPIRPEHIDDWLQPDPNDLAAQRRILEDRADLFYEHRLAA
ncbi:MAG: SOS response-associated peptidase family protein [Caldimonas sp.]